MRITRRSFLFSIATVGAVASGLGRSPAYAGVTTLSGRAFGSSWRVVVPAAADARQVRALVAAIVAETDMAMSPYLAQSELSRFNRSNAANWQRCSRHLAVVASEALRISQVTGGAFDPTVGPLVGRLGFGPISGARGLPGDIAAGAEGLRKSASGLTLDLCGIAKGYALDRIIEELVWIGIASAFAELGGEVRALGEHPEGRAWRAGIARPDGPAGAVYSVIEPGGLALATSGTGQQGIEFGANGLTHLIEPRAWRSVNAAPASVSVLAQTAMRADALATALMVMGPDTGPVFAEENGISALFLNQDGDGWRETMTVDFDRHILA
ncbi:Membrane-associated lipoprotein involved in thiamine biosynthesis [Hoeflea phototrophica DFL-43]|uniref:FAD:protein FMN transferase n=1 Tax=Hoeflea phototrophica (strain DSM 17068 / NCIMB 14078 / DFL-43) TaxID=411684 RepID=A9D201_HOEPD|nr:FAD:protein FMN transferase [Hoeflea phototrophica]EDQ34533.1 Membrane-associated lipoprotein involved in thiamine biosynthesis [Hoeflea phototrophica DFL-43]